MICERCNSDVLVQERVIAGGKVFHRLCFICSNPACHIVLSCKNYEQKGEKIYCKQCAKTRFAKAELGSNGIYEIGYQPDDVYSSAHPVSSLKYDRNAYLSNASYSIRRYDENYKSPPASVAPISLKPISLDLSGHSTISGGYQTSPASLREGLSKPTWMMSSRKDSSSSILNRSQSMAKPLICHRCSKTVYNAEKVVAAGKIWHKLCFRCHDCGKSLAPGKFCDRHSEIFCNNCYGRNFGPKGVGCGIGSGVLQMHQ